MTVRGWPALDLKNGEELTLRYERGVYGKVHGAATDFRWIACSPGFDPRGQELERQLYLGVEDRPVRSVYWRALGDRYFAVGGYPSRATDAAGRSGSFEKQVIEWEPGGLPAVLGALVLLRMAAGYTDDIWWDRRARLLDSFEPLEIDRRHFCPEVRVSDGDLEKAIEGGCKALEETGVTADSLTRLYAGVLTRLHASDPSGDGPEWFSGLAEPLKPDALAALLLPFERQEADRLSLAGWIPSSRTDLSDLGEQWNILVAPPDFSQPVLKAYGDEIAERARRMAEAVFERDPDIVRPRKPAHKETPEQELAARQTREPEVEHAGRGEDDEEAEKAEEAREAAAIILPGRRIRLTEPSANAGPVVRELFDFSAHVARRFIEPDELAGEMGLSGVNLLGPEDPDWTTVRSWPREVAENRPEDVDREHWELKVEILRAAALVMAPEPEKARKAAAAAGGHFLDPTSNTEMPTLFFLGLLNRGSLDRFAEYAGGDIDLWIIHSLGVSHKQLRETVESSLGNWSRNTQDTALKQLLETSLESVQQSQEELPFGL